MHLFLMKLHKPKVIKQKMGSGFQQQSTVLDFSYDCEVLVTLKQFGCLAIKSLWCHLMDLCPMCSR